MKASVEERAHRRTVESLRRLHDAAAWEAEQPHGCTLSTYIVGICEDFAEYLKAIEKHRKQTAPDGA